LDTDFGIALFLTSGWKPPYPPSIDDGNVQKTSELVPGKTHG
jgi:hypothetical protein